MMTSFCFCDMGYRRFVRMMLKRPFCVSRGYALTTCFVLDPRFPLHRLFCRALSGSVGLNSHPAIGLNLSAVDRSIDPLLSAYVTVTSPMSINIGRLPLRVFFTYGAIEHKDDTVSCWSFSFVVHHLLVGG